MSAKIAAAGSAALVPSGTARAGSGDWNPREEGE